MSEAIDLARETRAVITVEEAGAVLGLSRAHAYASARNGTLPTVRFGRKITVPVPRLRALLGMAAA